MAAMWAKGAAKGAAAAKGGGAGNKKGGGGKGQAIQAVAWQKPVKPKDTLEILEEAFNKQLEALVQCLADLGSADGTIDAHMGTVKATRAKIAQLHLGSLGAQGAGAAAASAPVDEKEREERLNQLISRAARVCEAKGGACFLEDVTNDATVMELRRNAVRSVTQALKSSGCFELYEEAHPTAGKQPKPAVRLVAAVPDCPPTALAMPAKAAPQPKQRQPQAEVQVPAADADQARRQILLDAVEFLRQSDGLTATLSNITELPSIATLRKGVVKKMKDFLLKYPQTFFLQELAPEDGAAENAPKTILVQLVGEAPEFCYEQPAATAPAKRPAPAGATFLGGAAGAKRARVEPTPLQRDEAREQLLGLIGEKLMEQGGEMPLGALGEIEDVRTLRTGNVANLRKWLMTHPDRFQVDEVLVQEGRAPVHVVRLVG